MKNVKKKTTIDIWTLSQASQPTQSSQEHNICH